ncbi:MAG TPA: AMP-binding protein, partial [Acidimicrobiia bacterium]|nr:AMP-binding protein [Acidimicrobiia bacterium]
MTITSIAEIIRTYGESRPDAPALEYEGTTTSYGELHRRSSQLANALAEVGIKGGDRVAFLDKNCPEYFEVTFALAKLNATNVAVNWRLAPAEMAQVINDAGARALVVGSEFVAHVEKIEGEIPTVKTIVAIGGHPRWIDYAEFRDSGAPDDPGVQSRGDDVAFQLYTSGTTGLPKGVMLTNDNFFKGAMQVTEAWRFTPDSVNLAVMPMFHIAGTGWSMVGMLHGCQTVLLRDVDPARILELIEEFQVTNVFIVPAVIQFLLITPGVEDVDFAPLRAIVYGASPITDTTLVRAMEVFGCEFIQVYGLTETTGAITQLDGVDHDPVNRPGLLRSCGKPYPWVELRIVDPDSGLDVPVGDVGEILIRGPQVMKGYWNNDAATAEAVDTDGWFR